MNDIDQVATAGNISDGLLGHQRQAERLFCACAFTNPELVRHDCGWLNPGDFCDTRYAQFWADVRNGKDQYQAAIEAKVYTELLTALNDVVSSYAYQGFAETIADDVYLLRLAKVIPGLAVAVNERRKTDVLTMIDSLAKDKPVVGDTLPSMVDVALELSEMVEQDRRTVKSYIAPLDNSIGGFERQTLTILAARPSMGKTALAFQIARNAAKAGHKTLYVSIEMSRSALWARAICGVLEVEYRDVLDKNMSKLPGGNLDAFRSAAINLAAEYNDMLLIEDKSRMALEDIWQRVAKYSPDFLVVDHQGLVSHTEDNPVKRAGMVAWGLKQIGKEFEIPVIMLQQLSRKVEERDNKRPVMSDLRDSGELEEIGDTVIFIYRDDYYKPPEEQPKISETELIIAKHRNGARNQGVKVLYHLPRQWFYRRGDI